MVTRTFCKLTQLSELWTDDAAWQRNVQDSGVADGYTLASNDEDGCGEHKEFACDELEFVEDDSVQLYDFMGSANEEERFYGREEVVYRDKATGGLWVMYREDLYDM